MRRIEELRAIGVEVVAVGAEVVVDDIDEDHQAEAVRCIDERLELVGRAVGGIGRERQHAVVAPVAPAGGVGERHQLDRRDAELGEVAELRDRGDEAAFGGEAADVQLVDHRLGPGPAAPRGIAPFVGTRVDHLAGGVDVAGIEARGRVGNRQTIGHPEAVAVAGLRVAHHPHVPAVAAALHRQTDAAGMPVAARPGDEFEPDLLDARCPEREADAAGFEHRSAEGHLVGASQGTARPRLSSATECPCNG